MRACKVTLLVAWSHCKAFGFSPENVGGVGHDVARTPLVKLNCTYENKAFLQLQNM